MDFGDGKISSLENPGHIFESPGVYDVSLTVTGPRSSDTTTRTITVIPYKTLEDTIQITGSQANDHFGTSVADLVEFYSDWYYGAGHDFIIGAPGWKNTSGQAVGAAFVYYEGLYEEDLSASNARVTYKGNAEGDHFGAAVAGAGNLNQDNYGM